MIPVRDQNKAKETDVRPEADESGRGTGVARKARKGDVSWEAKQRQWPGLGWGEGMRCPCGGPKNT
jgi:hypothetical protein